MNETQGMATQTVGRERKRISSPLSPQRNHRPLIPLLIRLFFHLGRKANRTHDPISKFLVQYRLVRVPIVLDNLIQPVNQRLPRRHVHHVAPEGKAGQLLLQRAVLDIQDRGELFHVFGSSLRLAVKDGGDGDFIATELLGNVGEGELFGGFGGKEGVGLDREAVSETGLHLKLVIDTLKKREWSCTSRVEMVVILAAAAFSVVNCCS